MTDSAANQRETRRLTIELRFWQRTLGRWLEVFGLTSKLREDLIFLASGQFLAKIIAYIASVLRCWPIDDVKRRHCSPAEVINLYSCPIWNTMASTGQPTAESIHSRAYSRLLPRPWLPEDMRQSQLVHQSWHWFISSLCGVEMC